MAIEVLQFMEISYWTCNAPWMAIPQEDVFCLCYLLVFFLKSSYVGTFLLRGVWQPHRIYPQFCWKQMGQGSLHFQAGSFPPLMLGFQDIYGSSARVAVYSAWCAEQWVCPVCFLTHTPYSFYCCFAQDGIAGRSAQKLTFFLGTRTG